MKFSAELMLKTAKCGKLTTAEIFLLLFMLPAKGGGMEFL